MLMSHNVALKHRLFTTPMAPLLPAQQAVAERLAAAEFALFLQALHDRFLDRRCARRNGTAVERLRRHSYVRNGRAAGNCREVRL